MFVALKCCPEWADEQPAHHSIDVTKTQCQSEIPPVGVCNGKANPVKAWTGTVGSRRLTLPYIWTIGT